MKTKPVVLTGLGWFFFGCSLTALFNSSSINGGLFATAAALCLVSTIQSLKQLIVSILLASLMGISVWGGCAAYQAKQKHDALTQTFRAAPDSSNDAVNDTEKAIQEAFANSLSKLVVKPSTDR